LGIGREIEIAANFFGAALCLANQQRDIGECRDRFFDINMEGKTQDLGGALIIGLGLAARSCRPVSSLASVR